MLTADAFGILPPIARLTRDQALYYFLSGFTAKLAGTEIGVQEPQPTFSTCFGAPFLPQPPGRLRAPARREARRARRRGVARQHRLDGRPLRRGAPDADPGDAQAAARRALRRARPGRLPRRRRLRLRRPGRRSRASSVRCSTHARRGATRAPTTRRRRSWPRCSRRTSRSSRPTPATRSAGRAARLTQSGHVAAVSRNSTPRLASTMCGRSGRLRSSPLSADGSQSGEEQAVDTQGSSYSTRRSGRRDPRGRRPPAGRQQRRC